MVWPKIRPLSLIGLFFTLYASASAQQIKLKSFVFDPSVRVPSAATSAQLEQKNPFADAAFLVQLNAPKSDEDDFVLEQRGLRVVSYIPDRCWIVLGRVEDLDFLRNWKKVRWVGDYGPGLRISPEFGRRMFKSSERLAETLMGIHRATLTLFDGVDPEMLIQSLADQGVEIVAANEAGPRWLVEVRGSLSEIMPLARRNDVAFIEESTESMIRNDITCWVIQSNTSGQTPIWAKGIHGEGQIAGLIDGALYKSHNCFSDPSNGNVPGPTHRKLIAYFSSTGDTGSDTHGTHTGGILGGDHEPIDGSTYRNGMAYKNKIAFTNLNDHNGTNLYALLLAMHNVGARDYSNSWGDDGTTAYTSDCQAIDQFSWDFQTDMVAFAVTNTSTLKTPENAKSVLAVGNTSQAPNQNNPSTGGTGPTSDGRRKPEIWAPGTGINSARAGTTNQWTSLTGTSMACPAITGGAQLIRQYYTQGWLKRGIAGGPSVSPSGALIRASIMNSGVDMSGMSGYPGVREGWGRMLLDNVMWFAGEPRKTLIQDVLRADGVATGGSKTFRFTVIDSTQPLRITMSFSDYPAAIMAASAPVNNIDLQVTAPGGTLYLGNAINTTTGQSVTGGAADAINSTEMVLLSTPPTGVYTVKVVGAAINQGGTQGYALVVNGGVRAYVNEHP